MFKNRLANTIIVVSIAVLTVFTMGTVIYIEVPSNMADHRTHTHESDVAQEQSLFTDPNAIVRTDRVLSAEFVAMKDRQLGQMDVSSVEVAADTITAQQRYTALKDRQLEQPSAFTILVTGSTNVTGAARYSNLKDAQLERLNPSETMSAGRRRYMNLKEVQLDR